MADDTQPSTRPKWRPRTPLGPLAPGQVRLLTGGNPQIPKGDGPDPVRAYISAMPGWKSAIGARIDELVTEEVPQSLRAVRWNTPFWGVAGQGWFLSLSCTTGYVKLAFHRGCDLLPQPPVASKLPAMRYAHVQEEDALDQAQMRDWLRQAAALKGDMVF